MPKSFVLCIRKGGRVRTLPSKRKICFDPKTGEGHVGHKPKPKAKRKR